MSAKEVESGMPCGIPILTYVQMFKEDINSLWELSFERLELLLEADNSTFFQKIWNPSVNISRKNDLMLQCRERVAYTRLSLAKV